MRTALVAAMLGFVAMALMVAVCIWLLALFKSIVCKLQPDGVRALRPKPGMPDSEPAGPREQVEIIDGKAYNVSRVPVFPDRRQDSAFLTKQGDPLPTRAAWGDLPYEELAPMFLDQFLLRYFSALMPASITAMGIRAGVVLSPWGLFVDQETWAKEMPLLFEQLTGYKLNDRQLNEAIGEYISRLEKSQRAATSIFHGGLKAPTGEVAFCPECNTLVDIVPSNCSCSACRDTKFFVEHTKALSDIKCEGSGHGYKPLSAATPGQRETQTTG